MRLTLLKKVFKDIMTTPNGDYDPARVIGYGAAAVGSFVFFICTLYTVFKTGTFNAVDYGIGMTGVCAAIAGAAGGVLIKKSDEIPYTAPTPTPTSTKDEPVSP